MRSKQSNSKYHRYSSNTLCFLPFARRTSYIYNCLTVPLHVLTENVNALFTVLGYVCI